MTYSIRSIHLSDFKSIYRRIENDFIPEEHAPYAILYEQLKQGVQKGLVLTEGEREVAYAICAGEDSSEYVLISLLAVYKEFRGVGIGSAFLQELKKMYSGKKGLIIEVEKPENALDNEEKSIRQKRIEFYQKAGFYVISDIEYSIWDIPMHLMALPHKVSNNMINKEIGQVIYEIYLAIMGRRYIHKMKFRRL